MNQPDITTTEQCYHCGDNCSDQPVEAHGKVFCCEGCKLVYEILEENQLDNYYRLNEAPGNREKKDTPSTGFDFLDNENIRKQLISFSDKNISTITFLVPQIHCSSCIWLLEHLYKINPAVKQSRVNFLRREASITFDEEKLSLKELVRLLDKIGYRPHISLDNASKPVLNSGKNKIYYRLGVAFFSFGNIMLLSFPEYFGLESVVDEWFRSVFGLLNILLSLPVLLYSATGFFSSALQGLKQGRLNMDFPITLGIIAMYGRSIYEILSGTGAGYMDTFSGLVFFMLAGRLFQDKSYERLSFERDYKSYFPIAVTVLKNGGETSKPLNEISPGEKILVRNEELIPVDSLLLNGVAAIDYSFVTGEQDPVPVKPGEMIYAGGKQTGTAIELEVVKSVSQSRLTALWNEKNYSHKTRQHKSVVDRISVWFTAVIVLIAVAAGSWYTYAGNIPTALNAFTAVLIITCPCALALSYPFALGNSIRILGRNKLFLKNTGTIETMAGVTDLVFDKTGTLTYSGESKITYTGTKLSQVQTDVLTAIFSQSSHTLSKKLRNFLKGNRKVSITDFHEYPGKGLQALHNSDLIMVGSRSFAGEEEMHTDDNASSSKVFWSMNGKQMGYFEIRNHYRTELRPVIEELGLNYNLHVLSGDHSGELKNLSGIFPDSRELYFDQTPADKLRFIESLQKKNASVLMCGDGLNDAGALMQSDCGIAMSENVNNFSPASDGILEAGSFGKIPTFLKFAKASMRVIFASYAISFLYNTIGISFAVQGHLSPLVAAVIMPLSTVSIVFFTTFSTTLLARRYGLNR